jgi:hypothetical protein
MSEQYDKDKDLIIKEILAEQKAIRERMARWEEQKAEDVFKAARSAPTGTPLSGVLGPTAKLAVDRAERGPDRDQLDLINAVGIVRPGGK